MQEGTHHCRANPLLIKLPEEERKRKGNVEEEEEVSFPLVTKFLKTTPFIPIKSQSEKRE